MENGIRILTATDIATVTPSKQDSLGAVGQTSDGRRYRYAGFGGTATINAGAVVVAAAKTANSNNLAIAVQQASNLAIGSRVLVVTNGATAVTQDQFADGFVEVISTSGAYAVRIEGNTAASAGGAITLQLAAAGLVGPVVAGTDTVNLTASPYAAAVPSTTQSAVVGVTAAQVPNTASVSNFGWVQVGGHAVVAASSAVKGQVFTQDSVTAGNIKTASAFTDADLGFAKESAANGVASVELAIQ
jgi:hypothetical protein